MDPITQFRRIVGDGEGFDLVSAWMAISQGEYRALDSARYLDWLERAGDGARRRLRGLPTGLKAVQRMSEYFGGELSFRGNEDDYYDPRNSYVNQVIERRLGVPISLSLLYVEIARRGGLEAEGVGLPGHYVVGVRDGRRRILVDAYEGGRIVTPTECRRRVEKIYEGKVDLQPRDFRAASKRDTLGRILRNLKMVYWKKSDFPRAARSTEMLLVLTPDNETEWRDLALALIETGTFGRSMELLEKYLHRRPDGEDAPAVRQRLKQVKALLATLN